MRPVTLAAQQLSSLKVRIISVFYRRSSRDFLDLNRHSQMICGVGYVSADRGILPENASGPAPRLDRKRKGPASLSSLRTTESASRLQIEILSSG